MYARHLLRTRKHQAASHCDPVPRIDGRDSEDQVGKLSRREFGCRALVPRIRHAALPDACDHVCQLQRHALALREQRALAPGRQRIETLLALPRLARVTRTGATISPAISLEGAFIRFSCPMLDEWLAKQPRR